MTKLTSRHRARCIKQIIENGVEQFKVGTIYEIVLYGNKEIQGRTEFDQYLTVSDSGSWKFRDYFKIIA